jgi:hypothetical protein
VKKFDYLLDSKLPFILYTDHKNLKYLLDHGNGQVTKRPSRDRLLRWATFIRGYNYEIRYIEGQNNVWSDLLTRWGCPQLEKTVMKSVRVYVTPVRTVVEEESMASKFGENEHWPSITEIREAQSSTDFGGDVCVPDATGIYRHVETGAIYVPGTNLLRTRLIVIAHGGIFGHRRVDATLRILKKDVWWPELHDDVIQMLAKCIVCLKSEKGYIIPRPLGHIHRGHNFNEVVHLDFMSMEDSNDGLRYLLVMKDDFSGFCRLYSTPDATAISAVHAIMDWIANFQMMKVIISDQGPHFKNLMVNRLTQMLKINHHMVVAYSPWSNGSIERLNREVKRAFKTLLLENGMNPKFIIIN